MRMTVVVSCWIVRGHGQAWCVGHQQQLSTRRWHWPSPTTTLSLSVLPLYRACGCGTWKSYLPPDVIHHTSSFHFPSLHSSSPHTIIVSSGAISIIFTFVAVAVYLWISSWNSRLVRWCKRNEFPTIKFSILKTDALNTVATISKTVRCLKRINLQGCTNRVGHGKRMVYGKSVCLYFLVTTLIVIQIIIIKVCHFLYSSAKNHKLLSRRQFSKSFSESLC